MNLINNFKHWYRRKRHKPKQYTVFYYRQGRPWLFTAPNALHIEDFETIYQKLGKVDAYTIDEVYDILQGENWCVNGSFNGLIMALGLHHTSMDVGDIIQNCEGLYFAVESLGFKRIHIIKEGS